MASPHRMEACPLVDARPALPACVGRNACVPLGLWHHGETAPTGQHGWAQIGRGTSYHIGCSDSEQQGTLPRKCSPGVEAPHALATEPATERRCIVLDPGEGSFLAAAWPLAKGLAAAKLRRRPKRICFLRCAHAGCCVPAWPSQRTSCCCVITARTFHACCTLLAMKRARYGIRQSKQLRCV